MEVLSGIGDHLEQEIAVPRDSYNLLSRELCGRIQLVVKPTKSDRVLPDAVFNSYGWSLRLDGAEAVGFEGTYDYSLLLYIQEYGLVQETSLRVVVKYPVTTTAQDDAN